MIIAIPVDDNKTDVCVSFGRAPCFLFYNTETNTSEFADNTAAAAQGGAGIKSAQFIVDKGAGTLITERCGENAAEVLKAAGIAVYKAEGTNVDENLSKYAEGKLTVLTAFHPGFHGKA